MIGDEVASKLTDFEKRIVNRIAEHGRINISEAMNLMPRPRWHTARAKLLKLVELGIVKHISRYSQDPTGHFVLAKAGDTSTWAHRVIAGYDVYFRRPSTASKWEISLSEQAVNPKTALVEGTLIWKQLVKHPILEEAFSSPDEAAKD